MFDQNFRIVIQFKKKKGNESVFFIFKQLR